MVLVTAQKKNTSRAGELLKCAMWNTKSVGQFKLSCLVKRAQS